MSTLLVSTPSVRPLTTDLGPGPAPLRRIAALRPTVDLGVLAARCPRGRLKSLIGQILSEELGDGDPERAHLRLYDRFLESIGALPPGASEQQLEALIDPEVHTMIAGLEHAVVHESRYYAIGLRGMGGECICGVYFSVMNEYLRRHPFIRANRDRIEWTFWDIHAGTADAEHDALVRQAIEAVVDQPDHVADMARGYQHGAQTWDAFWKTVYKSHVAQVACDRNDEARVCRRYHEPLCGTAGTAQTAHDFVALNVSRTGLLVQLRGPIEIGHTVSVVVGTDAPVVCRATVLRSNAGLVALRFVDFQLNESAWDRYVDRLEAARSDAA